MKSWKDDFNDILSCLEMYNLSYPGDIEAAIQDLLEIHPEVNQSEVIAYLKEKYPNETVPSTLFLKG